MRPHPQHTARGETDLRSLLGEGGPSRAEGVLNWSTASEFEPLTPEVFAEAMENLKRRSDEWWAAPKGPCGCPACVVHPKAKERLDREGGYARCANCFSLFHIPAPEDR